MFKSIISLFGHVSLFLVGEKTTSLGMTPPLVLHRYLWIQAGNKEQRHACCEQKCLRSLNVPEMEKHHDLPDFTAKIINSGK
jgi:hypothetical protein